MEEQHETHPLIVCVILFGICKNLALIENRDLMTSEIFLTFVVEVVCYTGMSDFQSNLQLMEKKRKCKEHTMEAGRVEIN